MCRPSSRAEPHPAALCFGQDGQGRRQVWRRHVVHPPLRAVVRLSIRVRLVDVSAEAFRFSYPRTPRMAGAIAPPNALQPFGRPGCHAGDRKGSHGGWNRHLPASAVGFDGPPARRSERSTNRLITHMRKRRCVISQLGEDNTHSLRKHLTRLTRMNVYLSGTLFGLITLNTRIPLAPPDASL